MNSACSAVSTSGSITPSAPQSSARAMKSYSVAGTRASGTTPSARQSANCGFRVSKLTPVCSMQYIAYSAPAFFSRRGMPGVKNSKIIEPSDVLPAASFCLTAFSRIAELDRGAARFVEEMHPLRIKREPDVVVRLDAHRRIHARHHRRAAGAEIDQDLVAERLHHVDLGGEAVVGLVGAVGRVQSLGPHAEHHALAGVRAHALAQLRRHL